MDYFEKRFEGILNSCSFTMRMYAHDQLRCEQCYRAALGEMEAIFNRHDYHDGFSKRLMDSKKFYQRRLKKAYLGI